MQSYSMRSDGRQTLLQLDEVAVPMPGPGQLLVRLHAAGLNRGEFLPGGLQAKGGAAKPAGMGSSFAEPLKMGVSRDQPHQP